MKPRAGPLSWIAAIVLAVLFHGAFALALTISRSEGVAEAPGVGGIKIALGPKGGAPGSEAASEADIPPEETQIEDDPSPPTPMPEPAPPEQAEPPQRHAARAPSPDLMPVEAAASAVASHEETLEPAVLPDRAGPLERALTQIGVGGKAGPEDSENAGDRGADLAAGGVAGAEADYAAMVLAWLQHHKRYPRRAEARRQEGLVRLYIAVDRGGQVLEGRIESGAGYRLLDQAALDMLARATPLPPLPDKIPGERLEIIVPVHFFLK